MRWLEAKLWRVSARASDGRSTADDQVVEPRIRHAAGSRSVEVAELAVRHRDEGVVGFEHHQAPGSAHSPSWRPSSHDPSAEASTPPSMLEALACRRIWEALSSSRRGWSSHQPLKEDITVQADGSIELGRLASLSSTTTCRSRFAPHQTCSRERPRRSRSVNRPVPRLRYK